MAGPEALEVYNTFAWQTDDDNSKVDKIIEKFDEYCNPRKNVTWERHKFNTRNQQPGESIDQYVTDLKTKAQTCEFDDLKDSLIRDRIVCGIICNKTRARLLKEGDLTLQKALDICRANEATSTQLKTLSSTTNKETQHATGSPCHSNKVKVINPNLNVTNVEINTIATNPAQHKV